MWLQIGATLAVVPLLTCGAIAGEKERETLELLMVTKLSLQEIIFEKFAAHFVSIASLQLLSLPLMALAYPMGGVQVFDLLVAFMNLLCATVLAVAWANICSSWAYTTQGALLGYLTLAPVGLFVFLPTGALQQVLLPIIALYGCALLTGGLIIGAQLLEQVNEIRDASDDSSEQRVEPPEPPRGGWTYGHLEMIAFQTVGVLFSTGIGYFPWLAWSLLAIVFTAIVLAMLIAVAPSVLLVRSRSPALRRTSDILIAMERAVNEVNDLAGTGIVLTPPRALLCGDRPIEWRELRRLVYRPRMLMWSVVACEFILTLIIYWGQSSNIDQREFEFRWAVLEILAWILAIGSISIQAASLFPMERTRQTLPMLLATPLSSVDIVNQKVAGAMRLTLAWSVPLATMWLVRTRIEMLNLSTSGSPPMIPESASTSDTMGFFIVLGFPLLVAWLGTYCGLCWKSRVHSLLATIGMVAMLCLLPWAFSATGFVTWLWCCPLTPMSPEEWSSPSHGDHAWWKLIVRIVALLIAILGLRALTLRRFSSFVGRLEPSAEK